MFDQEIDCIVDASEAALPLHAIRPDGLATLLDSFPPAQSMYLRDLGFTGGRGEIRLLPGPHGVAGAVVGLGDDRSPFAFGGLATALPAGTVWRLTPGAYDPAAYDPGAYDVEAAVLGFCLGAYRFTRFKAPSQPLARLVRPLAGGVAGGAAGGMTGGPDRCANALSQAAATWMVRDLINTPANLLGPVELAAFAADLGRRFGAVVKVESGDALEQGYPAIAAVGRGSVRPPQVATFHWRGSQAAADAPLVSLCGKGVCFDTGGYDLKPSAGMLRMKKDMGGAATVLGLARLIMEADLPLRLAVRVGCVENSVSGDAMRPSDVIRTRSGKTVEIGNTDAEGRLVLCDLLTAACAESPAIVIDCATLTGAARAALGPDLPAMFCNDDGWAQSFLDGGIAAHDPLWRLPLWQGYDDWLASPVADMNNVSSKTFAGAIVGALFLRRFVEPNIRWAHIDLYAWNDQTRPGRPEGGEAQAMRALFASLSKKLLNSMN